MHSAATAGGQECAKNGSMNDQFVFRQLNSNM